MKTIGEIHCSVATLVLNETVFPPDAGSGNVHPADGRQAGGIAILVLHLPSPFPILATIDTR